MRYTWDIVVRLRPVIVVAALAYLILALPSQILELYLIDIETVRGESFKFYQRPEPGQPAQSYFRAAWNTYTVWCAMLAGLGAMGVMWLASIHLLCLIPDYTEWSRIRRWFATAVVLLIALAPMLGVLTGLITILGNMSQIVPVTADISDEAESLKRDVVTYVRLTIALAILAASSILLLTVFRSPAVTRWSHALFSPVGLAVWTSAIALLTAAIVIWPTGLPWLVGTQAMIYLFLAALALVLTWFSEVYRRTGWPVTVFVIAGSVLFSMLGLNDNHKVEHRIATTQNNTLEKGFESWLLSRQDRAWYAEQKRRYPVYIVATEGGGMFAGYHAASWLGDMQDECSGFAQHVFAISSVSGGSLGAAVFAGLARQGARNQQFMPCEVGKHDYSRAVDRFFLNDLLAPLVSATLFPDFVQRLLPWPLKALDRAASLEEAMSQSWDRSVPDAALRGVFKKPLSELWDPTGATPALFLNATSVAAGARVTIGPMYFRPTSTSVHINNALCIQHQRDKLVDMPLASAVTFSARFPWLTPAGWLDLRDSGCQDKDINDRLYLVDGGYFENSGLETALDISRRLHATTQGRLETQLHKIDMAKLRAEYPFGIDIKIIMIFSIDQKGLRYMNAAADRSSSRGGEILPPIQTMLAGRTARTRAIHAAAVEAGQVASSEFGGGFPSLAYPLRGEVVTYGQDAVHQVALDGTRNFLPLGWRLSRRSLTTIGNASVGRVSTNIIKRELMGRDSNDLK